MLRLDSNPQSRVLTNLADFRAISADWTRLWRRCPDATVFQRPEWLLSWIHVFQPSVPLLIEFRLEGRLIGLAPLLQFGSSGEQVLGLMGGGVSDYLDVLIDPDFAPLVLNALWERIVEMPDWRRLSFTDLLSSSYLLCATNSGVAFENGVHDTCSSITLPESVEDLRTVIPRKTLSTLRNGNSRLRKRGTALFELATQGTLESMLEDLFRLHQKRWEAAGQLGTLSDSQIRQFHGLAASELLKAGMLRLYALNLDGKRVSVLYAMADRQDLRCYLQGFDPAHQWLSPGAQLLSYAIQRAVREGRSRVDLMRGEETYKHHWGVNKTLTFRAAGKRKLPLSIAA